MAQKMFPIEIHTSYLDGELSQYRCSHTRAEIIEALNNGYIVVANGTNDTDDSTIKVTTLLTSYDDYENAFLFGYSAFNCDGDTVIEPL